MADTPLQADSAHDNSPDTLIEQAWERRQAAYAGYHALPVDADTQAEAPYWSVIDAAEETIRSTTARTLRGVTIQLWVALDHSQWDRDESRLIQGADLEALLARDTALDWNARLMLSALRSLAAMEA